MRGTGSRIVMATLCSAFVWLALATGGEARGRHTSTPPAGGLVHLMPTAKRASFRQGFVIVGFRPGVGNARRRSIERRVGATGAVSLAPPTGRSQAAKRVARRTGLAFRLDVARGRVKATVAALVAQRRWVRYAEPDYVLQASAATVPNDPYFSLQWGSLNTGQVVNGTTGTAGADDGVAKAWGISTGSPKVVIAEVDSGIDYTHPDLAANIWSNPGGIGGCPAGTHGYNVLNSTCDPMDDETYYGGHGTHVAGIMGAVGNNGTGVAGVNWHTTILPVKWLNSSAWGDTSELISALNWVIAAKQAGVNIQVVNDSATFEGDAYSQALSDEIDSVGANGILFVTAAGNSGEDNDNPSYTRYPCGYDRPTEICVTASGENDTLPSWANYGVNTVDLAAPGADIYSTLRNDTYGYISGGSMAAATVSGAAALILSVQQMSTTALKADILNHVDPLASLSGLVRTGGRLDVCAAMPGCGSTAPAPSTAPANSTAPTISGTAQVGQVLTAGTGSWSGSPTAYAYSWSRCGASGCSAIPSATGSSYTVAAADEGDTLEVTVTASNSIGSSAATSAKTAVVPVPPPTFGYSSIGASSDSFSANRKRVNAYSLPTAGSLTKLSLYLSAASKSGQANIVGVVYADASGKPGALIGETSALAFSTGEATGWYDLPFSTPISLAAGRYWIGVLTGGTSGLATYRYTSVSGSRDYNTNNYSAGPSNPFGSVTSDSEEMSLYATYSAATSSSPAPSATAPVNSSPPTISGTAQVGQALSATTGTWSGSPTSYAYSWWDCASPGCTVIAGASGSSYVVATSDQGYALEVRVTASNSAGSSTASSAQSSVVPTATQGSAQTLGTTTVGSSSDTFSADRKRVNAYTLSSAASVSKLSLYLAPAASSGQADIIGLIYADSGGSPGALIAQTGQLVYSAGGAAGWYDLTFSSPVSLSAGKYWIGVLTGGTSGVAGFRYASVSGSRLYNSNTYSSGPSLQFGSASVDSEEMSLYATLS